MAFYDGYSLKYALILSYWRVVLANVRHAFFFCAIDGAASAKTCAKSRQKEPMARGRGLNASLNCSDGNVFIS